MKLKYNRNNLLELLSFVTSNLIGIVGAFGSVAMSDFSCTVLSTLNSYTQMTPSVL